MASHCHETDPRGHNLFALPCDQVGVSPQVSWCEPQGQLAHKGPPWKEVCCWAGQGISRGEEGSVRQLQPLALSPPLPVTPVTNPPLGSISGPLWIWLHFCGPKCSLQRPKTPTQLPGRLCFPAPSPGVPAAGGFWPPTVLLALRGTPPAPSSPAISQQGAHLLGPRYSTPPRLISVAFRPQAGQGGERGTGRVRKVRDLGGGGSNSSGGRESLVIAPQRGLSWRMCLPAKFEKTLCKG